MSSLMLPLQYHLGPSLYVSGAKLAPGYGACLLSVAQNSFQCVARVYILSHHLIVSVFTSRWVTLVANPTLGRTGDVEVRDFFIFE